MRDVSQRALGAMLGMTKKNGSVRINRYEQQTSRADMDTAAEIAKVLDIPIAYLYSDNAVMAEMVQAFSRLSQRDQQKALEFVKALSSMSIEVG